MGMNMSFIGGMGFKGVSTTQILSLVTDTLYDQFIEKEIKDFAGFHLAILDTFSTINMALPGKHYDVPSQKHVTDLFNKWKVATNNEAKKKLFTEFMKKNVHINKVDEYMIITAIVAPPTAMVAKRTGQTLPQLKFMKSVPDVVFVPSATVLALIALKILRLMFMKKTTSKDAEEPHEEQHPDASTSAPPAIEQKTDAVTQKETAPAPAIEQKTDAVTQKETAPAPAIEQKPPEYVAQEAAPAEDKTQNHAPKNSYCPLCKTFHH